MKFLSEILNQPYDVKMTRKFQMGNSSGHMHTYSFKSPNDKYQIDYSKPPQGTHAHLAFDSDKGDYGISGAEGRNAHRIFSTVVHATKHYLQNNQDVKGIHFTGEKDAKGRNGVYGMLAKKFSNKVTMKDHDDGKGYQHRSYYIDRKDMKGLDNEGGEV